MSQAQALLNTLNDVTAFADVEYAEDRITVDTDRFIHVPDSMRRLGVQHDHNIETVTFVCPRFWDGIDMSEMCIYVNYLRPDGVKGRFLTTNLTVEDETMTFDWVISNNVTQVKGKLSFLICIVKTNEDGLEEQHWNSELNQECYISEGMECHDSIVLGYPDVITHILLQMEKLSYGSGSGSDTPDDTPVVSAVQPDYSQNDSTQPDYIKNRTHWEESSQTVVRMSADAVLDVVDVSGEPFFYRVSDVTPTWDDLTGVVIEISSGGEIVNFITITEEMIESGKAQSTDSFMMVPINDLRFYIVREDNTDFSGTTFPKKGVYGAKVQLDNGAVYTFTYGSNTIKTIDEKFIPDTIARVADLGVFSWDELADKPFGDEYIELEWDGNTAGLETAFLSSTSAFYKISDIVLTAKDLVGGYCEITETNTYGGSASASRQIIEDMIYDRDDRIYVQLGIPAGSNCLLVVKTPINDGAVTPGLYFASISLNNYVYHISRFSHIITNRIPEKFIPDTIARVADIPEQKEITVNGIAPDENGNIEIKVSVDSPDPPAGEGVSSWNDLTDKPFYSEMVTIMEEQSITTVDNGGLYSYLFPEPLPLEVGCTVVVYYNGDKYEGVVKEAKAQGFLPFVYFGDLALQVGQQTEGEPPFLLLSTTVSNESMSGLFTPSVETCTIRVDLENVVRISDKYIPKQEIKHPLIGGAVGGISYTLSGQCTVLGARTIVRRIDNQLFDETGYLEASLLVVEGSLYVPFELGVKYAIFNVFSFPSKAQAETLHQSPTVWRLVMAADDEGVENFKSDYSISEWEDWV